MDSVTFEMDGQLAVITLNDPPLNVLGETLLEGLTNAFEKISNEKPRALLLQAQGDNFSAGADVNMLAQLSPSQARERLSTFMELLHMIEALPYPTMVAVQGICVAGGLEIALSMDMIWASDTCLLGQSEAMIGAIPFAGGAQRLAARCGVTRAKEIVYTGRFYPASDFEKYNIINRVVPVEDLKVKALKFMKNIAETGPTIAHGAAKDILSMYLKEGMVMADTLTIDKSVAIFETKDLQTGISSMLEQGPGKAKFSGE